MSYGQFYSTTDPYGGSYAAPYGAFAEVVGDEMLALVAGHELAFAFLDNEPGGRRIRITHRISRAQALPGHPGPWDNRYFGTYGDVTALGVTSVEVTAAFFGELPALRVLAVGDVTAALAAGGALVAPGVDEGEAVTVRRAIWVPSSYVPLLLTQGLTPRGAWDAVLAALTAKDDVVSCGPLLDWLRVALWYPDQLGQSPAITPLTGAVAAQRAAVHQADLGGPVGIPALQPGGLDLQATAAQISLMRQEAANRAAAREAADAKTPTKRWGAARVTVLLRLCRVEAEQELPAIWRQLAATARKDDRATLQWAVQDAARAQGTTFDSTLTARFAQDVARATFHDTAVDDVEASLSPFQTVALTEAERMELASHVQRHDDLQAGAAAPTLEALEKVQTTLPLPVDFYTLTRTLANFAFLLQVLLGQDHPVAVAYLSFQRDLPYDFLNAMIATDPLVPIHLVRHVQIRTQTWLAAQAQSHGPAPLPMYADLVTELRNRCWKPAPLPAMLSRRIPTPVIPPAASSASPASAPVAASPRTPSEQNYVRNLKPVVPFVVGQVREVMNVASKHDLKIPKYKGAEICLAWQIKHGCYTTCRNAGRHVDLDDAAQGALKAYLQPYADQSSQV